MNIIIYILASALLIMTIIIRYKIIIKKNKSIIQKKDEIINHKIKVIDNNFVLISKLSIKNSELKQRVIDLEDSIEEGYGIKIRQEITTVKADFNKFEMVMLLSGIIKLIKSSQNAEDSRILIELNDKIQGFIDNMKEN